MVEIRINDVHMRTFEIEFRRGGERWTKVIVDDRAMDNDKSNAREGIVANGARLENVIGTAPSIINW